MQPGAKNVLSVIGIIITSILTLASCALLMLLSMCAGGFAKQGGGFFLGAIFVLFAGIAIIVLLARGISRTNRQLAAAFDAGRASGSLPAAMTYTSGPLRISATGQQAIDYVNFALCASLILSLISWGLNVSMTSGRLPSLSRSWLMVSIVSMVLYNAPYALLLFSFLRKPSRHTFYYALIMPVVGITLTLLNVATLLMPYYSRNPRAMLFLVLSTALEILISVLAWKALRKNGVYADAGAITIAGFVALAYFLGLRMLVPFLYAHWR